MRELQGGLVDQIKSETANTVEGGAQATIFGIGGRGGYSRAARTEELRSFQEMMFVAFEQLANEEGLITELGPDYTDPDAWESGRIHASLSEGELIRISTPIQVLDGGLFGQRVARFEKMADAIARLGDLSVAPNATAKARHQALQAAKSALMGGLVSDQLVAMSDFVEAFEGDSISLRLTPCGADHLEFGFNGALLGRREYLQEEREHLFSRYGHSLSNWTAVLQVAAIPSEDAPEIDDSANALNAAGDINRAMMERMAWSTTYSS